MDLLKSLNLVHTKKIVALLHSSPTHWAFQRDWCYTQYPSSNSVSWPRITYAEHCRSFERTLLLGMTPWWCREIVHLVLQLSLSPFPRLSVAPSPLLPSVGVCLAVPRLTQKAPPGLERRLTLFQEQLSSWLSKQVTRGQAPNENEAAGALITHPALSRPLITSPIVHGMCISMLEQACTGSIVGRQAGTPCHRPPPMLDVGDPHSSIPHGPESVWEVGVAGIVVILSGGKVIPFSILTAVVQGPHRRCPCV